MLRDGEGSRCHLTGILSSFLQVLDHGWMGSKMFMSLERLKITFEKVKERFGCHDNPGILFQMPVSRVYNGSCC